MSVQNESKRIHFRGETAVFRVSFFADAAQTTPTVPLDTADFPSYTIFDIDNNAVQSGIGQVEASPGTYKVEFAIPPGASLSQDLSRWRIEWSMLSDQNIPHSGHPCPV